MNTSKSGFFDPVSAVVLGIPLIAGSVFILIYLFIASPVQIKGQAMEPNFHNGAYYMVSKLAYKDKIPARGDVIIHTTSDQRDFIKRVIGVPGDNIMLSNGQVYINGNLLEEPYLGTSTKTYAFPQGFIQDNITYDVPHDNVFVLGDNRDRSSDSREYGFISKKAIVGKVAFCYWDCNGSTSD